MNPITLLGLGPGSREYLTLGAVRALRGAPHIVLRTGDSDCAEYLKEEGIPFETLDRLYDQAEDFDELTRLCADEIIRRACAGPVLYAVPDPAQDETARELIRRGAVEKALPGVPLAAPALAAAGFPEALACAASSLPDALGDQALLIQELDDALLAGDVKLRLMDVYGQDQPVLFFPPEKPGQARSFQTIPLSELDRQKAYDRSVSALIIPQELTRKERFTVQDLVRIMGVLRGPDGCPWDRKQTHQSLRPYLIEEAYETAAAIDDEDWDHVAEELGDVLLQVVFQASIGAQYGTMTLSDIATAICRKMIERHPHIFGAVHADTADQVSRNWEEIKRAKRGLSSVSDAMKDVARSLPPLMRAEKVQKKAALVRFDFDGPIQALEKVHEEADEVLSELRAGRDPAREIGDLFFSCVNVARLAGVESETAMMGATDKFVDRFCRMEQLIKNDNKDLNCLTLQEFDVYWNRAKGV